MKTFKCDFGKGVTATMTVMDTPPEKGKNHIQGIEWTGNRTQRHIRPYIAWCNSVQEQLSNEWGIKIMQCYEVTKDKWDVWMFEPGKPPKFDRTIRGSLM